MRPRTLYSLILCAIVISIQVHAADIQFLRNLDMNNNTIKSVADPVGDQDVATKQYVDAATNTSSQLANVIIVSKNGNDTTANGSVSAPYLTIAAACAAAAAGDTVYVMPGVYEEGNISITDPISLIGSSAENTMIDASSILDSGEVLSMVFSGGGATVRSLTIKTGPEMHALSHRAQTANSELLIENNTFIGNDSGTTDQNFGLIGGYDSEGSVIIRNNTISNFRNNAILFEKQKGATYIENNKIYGPHPIFYMTYGGVDVTTPQIVSRNRIATTQSSAIYFLGAAWYVGAANRIGKYTEVEIYDNDIFCEADPRPGATYGTRGITLDNGATTGTPAGSDGAVYAKIFDNRIYGSASATRDTRALTLYGYIPQTRIHNNYIKGTDTGFKADDGGYTTGIFPVDIDISFNYFNDISDYAVVWDHTATFDATHNWFGDSSGPDDDAGVVNGTGGKVSANVICEPFITAGNRADDVRNTSDVSGHTVKDALNTVKASINTLQQKTVIPYWFCTMNTNSSWKNNTSGEDYEWEQFVVPVNPADHSTNDTVQIKLRIQGQSDDGTTMKVALRNHTDDTYPLAHQTTNLGTSLGWWESGWVELSASSLQEIRINAYTTDSTKYYYINRAMLLVR